ncbi:MAG: glycosyltransferase [Candidatus Micrarchaeota archaeon]
MEDPTMYLNYAIAFFSLFSVIFFLLLYLRHKDEYNLPPAHTDWRPMVSIVIPAYNESEYMRESLKTVLALNYPKDKLEIIVVDDGSKDNTLEIAKSFEKDGVVAVRKENSGKGAALNFGIKRARGELVATMDADSYLAPDTLLDLLPLFDEERVAAVTPAVKIRPSGNILKEVQRVEYLMILFSRKLLSYIDCVPVTPGPFSIFRKKVLLDLGGFDEHNLVEDQEIALRMQANHYKIRSSMTAEVYTEPPASFGEFLTQRVRWQRGGLRNYWKYRFLIKPEYGDFGMFFVPLNYMTIIAFFLLLGLFIYYSVSMPYYVRYIFIESLGLSIGLFTIIGFFVLAVTAFWLYVTVRSFGNEKVKARYVALFMILYWYFMVCYNVLTLWKELRREKTAW